MAFTLFDGALFRAALNETRAAVDTLGAGTGTVIFLASGIGTAPLWTAAFLLSVFGAPALVAAGFRVTVLLEIVRVTVFETSFLTAGFLAAVFLADFFAGVFLAMVFLTGAFFRAVFLTAGFLATAFLTTAFFTAIFLGAVFCEAAFTLRFLAAALPEALDTGVFVAAMTHAPSRD